MKETAGLWISINPMPTHNQKVDILLKSGRFIENVLYDDLEDEFFEIRNGSHYFHDLSSVAFWKKHL
jgi:hypothetical protein